MTAKIISGTEIRKQILEEIAAEVKEIKEKHGVVPGLVTILVGENPASISYVTLKIKTANSLGFHEVQDSQSPDISEEDLLSLIDKYNNDDSIHGILVQLPLPKHIDEKKVLNAIDPDKDVDGFHPVNVGRMVKNLPAYVSATPFGIMQLLDRYGIETSGKHCVVIGRSDIVGTPMAILLSRKSSPGNCTVTICHSRTPNIKELSLQAVIVIAALGIPEFLTGDMVKEGVVVIDVGITRVPDESKPRGYALKGDVKYDEVEPKASFITPVPGGVGPMTIAALLHNTLLASQKEIYQ